MNDRVARGTVTRSSPVMRFKDSATTADARSSALRTHGALTARAAVSGRQPGVPGEGNVSLVIGPPADGTSPEAVLSQRRRLLRQIGCDLEDGVSMQQVHGGDVAVVHRSDRGRGMRVHAEAVAGADALVTFETGVALMVMVADCVPVLLADPGRGVAAVHAGRGGVVHEVIGAATSRLTRTPQNIRALIGPAIGGCCYEVPEAMVDMFTAADAALGSATGRTTWGTPSIDLPSAVTTQLRHAGVRHIDQVGGCTMCENGEWFSHRADPDKGRQAAVIAMHPIDATEPRGSVKVAARRAGEFLHWQS